jgi:hypothetical protein
MLDDHDVMMPAVMTIVTLMNHDHALVCLQGL